MSTLFRRNAASSIADGGVMVAVRLANLVTPLRNGRLPGGGCRSALVIGGTRRIRTGEPVVFCKIVAVAPAQVRQDGRVQAKGSPVHHARLGPLEEWLEEQAGPGVIDGIAERAVLRAEYVKGERERLLAAGFMIRVIVLMTLVPGAGVRRARRSRWPGTWHWCRGGVAAGAGVGAGARGLAERARPGAAGGTAGRRAARLARRA